MKHQVLWQNKRVHGLWLLCGLLALLVNPVNAEVRLIEQYQVADNALFFNGQQVKKDAADNGNATFDYIFGRNISAHGDAIKVYQNFIFTTWYRGGKENRHLMLSRYNLATQQLRSIEFPHRHSGFQGKWWLGESHNTAAVGISPKDEKIHLLFDMHSYDNDQFNDDYFRYAFSVKGAATVADDDFNLALFVKDANDDYNHVGLNAKADPSQYANLTYPRFFLNNDNDLLMHMRVGGHNNGAYLFTQYNADTAQWANITRFNYLNAKFKGSEFNWGLYGAMKYVNGKLRVAFQRRSANNNDKYQYQNGVYYAYSDDQSGKTQWKDHTGKAFDIPLADADRIKIFEPGDLTTSTGKSTIHIVSSFAFTVTERGDVHIVSRVKDKPTNKTTYIHSYKPAGETGFTHSTEFGGAAELYTANNRVYIIRLNNGLPFVQETLGGTNEFKTIYQPAQGTAFDHGVPYIADGKLYYFLQEKGNKAALPIHVQVIDLGA